jgi:hypothetical protein
MALQPPLAVPIGFAVTEHEQNAPVATFLHDSPPRWFRMIIAVSSG